MEEAIIELLNNNLRVIIPDFGAFIVRQKKPRLIVFNEFLRFNDGLLINHIISTEGIEADVASQRVANFVDELNKMLNDGKPFTLKNLGFLQKDKSGKITFNQEGTEEKPAPKVKEVIENKDEKTEKSDKAEQKTAEKAKSDTQTKKIQKTSSEAKKKTTAKADAKQEAKESNVPDPEKVKEEQQNKTEDNIKDSTVEVKQPEAFVVESKKEEPVTDPQPEVKVPVETKQVETDKVMADDQTEIQRVKRKPKKTEIIIFILLFVVANVLIISYFVFGKGKNDTDEESTVNEVADTIVREEPEPVDLSVADTVEILKDFSDDETDEVATVQEDSPRFYIVAGCFRDENNADELVSTLKDQGYNAEKFGKIGNLHAVSFASFTDKEDAMTELRQIRENVSIDAWMTQF